MIRIIRYHGGKSLPYRLPDFQPGAARDVELDLTGELHGDTIADAQWTSDPSLAIGTPTNTDNTTTARITAPEAASVPRRCGYDGGYAITVTVQTSRGEVIVTPLDMWVRNE